MSVFKTPAHRLLALWLGIMLAVLFAVWVALQAPSLGLRLGIDASHGAVSVFEAPTGSGIPRGATLSYLQGADGRQFFPVPDDFIEEPDFFDTYQEMEAFFQRQGMLDLILRGGEVILGWQTAEGREAETPLSPRKRTLGGLPFAFWFQLAVGAGCFLIAGWVYALKPQDWGARMFLLSGIAFVLATFSAAVYSTRELALPQAQFRVLSHISHVGGMGFGMAIVALFQCYPHTLGRRASMIWIPAVFVPWLIADIYRWAPDVNWGFHIPMLFQLGLACGLFYLQWRSAESDPLGRASLRWFALSTLVACGIYVALIALPNIWGQEPFMSQAYAFGFLLIMYMGIALGLRRYRLFDIDEWAFRMLLWLAGVTAVVVLDVILILAGLQEMVSLGVALLIAGGLYFPFRQWLWRRMVSRQPESLEALLPALADFAFIAEPPGREGHWDDILRRAFDPLQISRKGHPHAEPAIDDEGLTLHVPPLPGMAPRTLKYAALGRRLFSTHDSRFAAALFRFATQIVSGKLSHEQGVRQERQRLARDLHDNLGARLLRLIHHLRGTPGAELAREAMQELRTAITAIEASPIPLDMAAEEWRSDALKRCEAANVELTWKSGELPELILASRVRAAVGAVLREAVSNALKHASPKKVSVVIGCRDEALTLAILNDGEGRDPARWREGYGLRNIRARLHDLAGGLEIVGRENEVCLEIHIPLGSLQS